MFCKQCNQARIPRIFHHRAFLSSVPASFRKLLPRNNQDTPNARLPSLFQSTLRVVWYCQKVWMFQRQPTRQSLLSVFCFFRRTRLLGKYYLDKALFLSVFPHMLQLLQIIGTFTLALDLLVFILGPR